MKKKKRDDFSYFLFAGMTPSPPPPLALADDEDDPFHGIVSDRKRNPMVLVGACHREREMGSDRFRGERERETRVAPASGNKQKPTDTCPHLSLSPSSTHQQVPA